MFRHVAEPLDAGGLEADVRVEAAGDGAVDDGLLLLLRRINELVQPRGSAPLGSPIRPSWLPVSPVV